MVTDDHIGMEVIVKAADDFYKFIDGWQFFLYGFDIGMAVVTKPSPEFPDVELIFYVDPEQVHAIEGVVNDD